MTYFHLKMIVLFEVGIPPKPATTFSKTYSKKNKSNYKDSVLDLCTKTFLEIFL